MDITKVKGIKKYTDILKNKDVAVIVNDILESYNISEISSINMQGDNLIIKFVSFDQNEYNAVISKGNITINKKTFKTYEENVIDNRPSVRTTYVDMRRKGSLIRRIFKDYGYNNETGRLEVTDIKSTSYGFTYESLAKHLELVSILTDSLSSKSLLKELYRQNIMHYLDEICDFKNTFETHRISPIYDILTGQYMKNGNYDNYTTVNGIDYSSIYGSLKGPDDLERIYDLFRGVINKKNIGDIKDMRLGLIPIDGLFFKDTIDSYKEEETLGESNDSITSAYKEKAKDMLKSCYYHGIYLGKIDVADRDSIIKAIKYKPSVSEIAKHEVESKLGISYDEFDKLDVSEQQALIEKKTGKKIRYVDDEEIYSSVTMEQVDEKLDEIIYGKNKVLRFIRKKLKNSK